MYLLPDTNDVRLSNWTVKKYRIISNIFQISGATLFLKNKIILEIK